MSADDSIRDRFLSVSALGDAMRGSTARASLSPETGAASPRGLAPPVDPPRKKHGSDRRQATVRVTIRMTPGEHAQLAAVAEQRGLSAGQLLKAALYSDHSLSYRPLRRLPDPPPDVRQATEELSRAGNVVNQALRRGLAAADEANAAVKAIEAAARKIAAILDYDRQV